MANERENVIELHESGYPVHSDDGSVEGSGDGGGGGDMIVERVTRLETEFRYFRRDLDEIRSGQRSIDMALSAIRIDLSKKPSTGQFWAMIGTVAALAFTFVLLIVGILNYVE